MRVCSDTSPLCNLAVIGRLALLWEQFSEVLIPEAVWRELLRMKAETPLQALKDAHAAGRLRVVKSEDLDLKHLLMQSLDEGEAEAIALAAAIRADLLLVDEHEGRKSALTMGIKITGLLGILRQAKLKGHIDSLRSELEKLRTQAHFFIAPHLEKELLRSVGEEL